MTSTSPLDAVNQLPPGHSERARERVQLTEGNGDVAAQAPRQPHTPIDLGTLAPHSYSAYFLLGVLDSVIRHAGSITPADWNDAIWRSQAFQSTQDDGAR